jgi:hypothetical protein
MAVVSGIDGSVTFVGGYTTTVTQWTINIGAEDIDWTSLGVNWQRHLAGVKNWSGTYNAWMDPTAATTLGSDPTVGGMKFADSAAAATFTFGTSAFTGNIIITGSDANLATESGAGEFTFTFVGDNALSIT